MPLGRVLPGAGPYTRIHGRVDMDCAPCILFGPDLPRTGCIKLQLSSQDFIAFEAASEAVVIGNGWKPKLHWGADMPR